MQHQLSVTSLEQLVTTYSTKQIADKLQLTVPQVRKLLKDNGFTYTNKKWVYVKPVERKVEKEQFGLTEEELMFFSEPAEGTTKDALDIEPIQIQPHLVEQLQAVCQTHDIPVEQFVEYVLQEAIERLQHD